jgi:colanic acid biosynthesis glycosyl transferase WcaI
MRILFVNQFYLPDRVATAQVLSDLCERLAAAGHDVHVLCSRRRYDEGDAHPTTPLPRRERIARVTVERVGGTALGKRRLVGQLVDFASFHALATARVLTAARRFDVIVTLTTPPLIGLAGLLAQSLTGVRHVCWVMNLHPDCEIEMGLLDRRGLPARLLAALAARPMRRADATVALGRCMADRIAAAGVPPERVAVIPLWAHGVSGGPTAPRESAFRTACGLDHKFVVMYAGNAGVEYSFDEICAAALRLRDDPRFAFVFIGGGRRTPEIDRFRRDHVLSNVHLHPYLPREQLKDALAAADVHLASLRPELAGVSVPCKLYGVMAVGRPVLFIGPASCATAETIRQHRCGRVLPPGDVDGLVRSLRELADDAPLRETMGEAGRRAFEVTYNADRGARQWQRLLEGLIGGPSAGRAQAAPIGHPGAERQLEGGLAGQAVEVQVRVEPPGESA